MVERTLRLKGTGRDIRKLVDTRCRIAVGATAALALVALNAGVAGAAAPVLVPFHNARLAYTIAYPAGWRHSSVQYGHIQADLFLRPFSVRGVTDNVNIVRLPLPAAASDADLRRQSERQVRQATNVTPHEIDTVTVDGHRLRLFTWTQLGLTGQRVVVTQAVLSERGYGWTFALTDVRGDEWQMRNVFRAMLARFHAL